MKFTPGGAQAVNNVQVLGAGSFTGAAGEALIRAGILVHDHPEAPVILRINAVEGEPPHPPGTSYAQGIVHAIRGQKDLEEAAGAYKAIDEVMANQTDLVKIMTELSPVAVIKG